MIFVKLCCSVVQGKNIRIPQSALKKRMDIPQPIRALMGEIDSAYAPAKTIVDLKRMIANANFFNQVSKRVDKVSETPKGIRSRLF